MSSLDRCSFLRYLKHLFSFRKRVYIYLENDAKSLLFLLRSLFDDLFERLVYDLVRLISRVWVSIFVFVLRDFLILFIYLCVVSISLHFTINFEYVDLISSLILYLSRSLRHRFMWDIFCNFDRLSDAIVEVNRTKNSSNDSFFFVALIEKLESWSSLFALSY